MSKLRTSLPIPTEPWERAKRDFLQWLPLAERTRFETATVENLFYDTSVTQKRHGRDSHTWRMQERLSPLVEAIEEYGKALDVFPNACGLILSPLWGGLRVIMHVSTRLLWRARLCACRDFTQDAPLSSLMPRLSARLQ